MSANFYSGNISVAEKWIFGHSGMFIPGQMLEYRLPLGWTSWKQETGVSLKEKPRSF
jgi:hypothetical protein